MGCVSSQELGVNGITENDINRFRVFNDTSLSSAEWCESRRESGILEVNDDELVHYQRNREPVRWSYKCLRRYGLGSDTFLFESGRRCSTGPGYFAFKCRRADILHNIFNQKLLQFSLNQGNSSRRQINAGTSLPVQAPTRYSDGLVRQQSSHVEEPYLIPKSSMNGSGTNNYVNETPNGFIALNYINLNDTDNQRFAVDQSPVRELNYAELDLPKSNAIGFPSAKSDHHRGNSHANLLYVDINGVSGSSSDEDDSAFASTSKPAAQYMNLPQINGKPAAPMHMEQSANSSASNDALQLNGIRPVLFGEQNNFNFNSPYKLDTAKSKLPDEGNSVVNYTIIDFQKTAAVASTSRPTQSDVPNEGSRKTRHDSSVENLEG